MGFDAKRALTEGMTRAEMAYLLEKWRPNVEAVRTVHNGLEDVRALALARCLETTDRALTEALHPLGETIQPDSIGITGSTTDQQLKRFYFDIITAVLPNMISQDLVSVQPISQKIAQIFYMSYKYGSRKGKIQSGDEMLDARRGWASGRQAADWANNDFTPAFEYGSETVSDEAIDSTPDVSHNYSGTLDWKPVRPGTMQIAVTVAAVPYLLKDIPATDGSGTGTLAAYTLAGVAAPSVVTASSVNYADGTYSFTLSADSSTAPVCDYCYNNEQAPANVPEVQIKIDSSVVEAKSRKLKALYAFDAGFDLRMQHGLDIDDVLQTGISNEIIHELDGEVCFNLLNSAQMSVAWNKVPASNIQYTFHKETFVDELVVATNKIFQKTQRAGGNFIIAGFQAASIIESLPAPQWVPAGNTKVQGPHFAGTLAGKYKVYKNPYFPVNKFLVGYKGDNFLDAGYVFAPYLPIFATQLIMAEDFQGRRGFATSNGQKLLNSNLYVVGTITTDTNHTVETDPAF